jgi:hypothetical protein
MINFISGSINKCRMVVGWVERLFATRWPWAIPIKRLDTDDGYRESAPPILRVLKNNIFQKKGKHPCQPTITHSSLKSHSQNS